MYAYLGYRTLAIEVLLLRSAAIGCLINIFFILYNYPFNSVQGISEGTD